MSWHEAFYGFMDDEHMIKATLSPVRYMPMVTPPRPWTRFNAGGYLRSESFIMRGHYSLHGPSRRQMLALHHAQVGAEGSNADPPFKPVLDALNVLGRTAWVINEDVLRVMEAVWANGGGLAGFRLARIRRTRRGPPVRTAFGSARTGQLLASSIPSREDVAGFIHALNKTKQTNRELHSQRCDFLIKLQVAKEMRGESRMYFPHNIDFRGRAYTMHVHLNHLGSDICRGALLFADAKPLGPDGLDWLCVQAANLRGGGVDKLPMRERVAWVRDRFDLVRDAARDPLGDGPGAEFWQEAEDPWQCLATCLEIAAALESGDPASYECRLPVHQDGSCNGLQHYAALGRDEAGGEQVNLMPRDRPGDVYTGIANVLKTIVAEDVAKAATDPETAKLALALAPHIDRKLVKQTVMTSVYGVTHVGARQQIQNRLKERGAIDDEDARYRVALYAAGRTLDALSNLFVNARSVMAWLAECAKVISSRGRAVEWTTPLGLPRRSAVPREGAEGGADAGAVVRAAVRQRREQGEQEQAAERVPAQLHPQRRLRAHDEDGGGVPRRGADVRGRARLLLDARGGRAGDVAADSGDVHRAARGAAAGTAVRGAQGQVPGARARDTAAAAAGGDGHRGREGQLYFFS